MQMKKWPVWIFIELWTRPTSSACLSTSSAFSLVIISVFSSPSLA
ncbi:MAG: hypothetical protein ACTSP4_13265 [Candidatus Hodarchaeales archaeon]